jgi:hypothetical protein
LDDGGVIGALAAGLGTWIAQAMRAEDRLATFAFREGGPPVDVPAPTSLRYFIGRLLGAAGDPATLRLLEATRSGGVPLDELLSRDDLGVERGDRVALAERIADAAAGGLVGRELEADRVACTPLGTALLDLVEALEAGVRGAGGHAAGGSPVGARAGAVAGAGDGAGDR